ncbi:MAG: hypothetical protein HY815_29135, partial [Candidatus Riflebacteria bacterium]|nr:hypothetical protein [Candidatus Riflebacteria bacterium]
MPSPDPRTFAVMTCLIGAILGCGTGKPGKPSGPFPGGEGLELTMVAVGGVTERRILIVPSGEGADVEV